MRQLVNQSTLLQVLNTIFPSVNIINNDRQVLKNPITGQVLELDCWLPDFNVALEFQDDYHYETKWYKHETIESVKLKDEIKRNTVVTRGDTYITIPYWWNGSKESTIGEIKFHRPDLFSNGLEACEIPLNPPYHSQRSNFYIPSHLDELMNPSFPPIGQLLNVNEFSPWWLGEKYDGIRVCWNPDLQVLTTRTDNPILSFSDYAHLFPSFFLDGELWCGRNNFSQCQRLLFSDDYFEFMRLMVFDVPVFGISFEERYKELDSISADHQFIKLAPRVFTNSLSQVEGMTKCILEQGGEGVIVQKPRTLYKSGRVDTVLKLKAHQRDGDALVVETYEKWFTIKLLHGVLIPLEESNLAEGVNVSKGDIITFSYDAINFQSLPSHIKILRVRNDITWEDLRPTEDFSKMISSAESRQTMLNAESARAFGQIKTMMGNQFSTQELQVFFNNLAKLYQIDPKKETDWYSLTSQKIREVKGGRTIEQYCGGIVSALQRAYPDMKFDPFKFDHKRKHFWEEPKNWKYIFDKYANKLGFDPNVSTNWYKYISNPSLNELGIQTRGSYIKMLIFAYPNIGLDPAKFYRNPKRQLYIQQQQSGPLLQTTLESSELNTTTKKGNFYWKNIANQKTFFDLFAKTNKFDPLIEGNWDHVLVKDIKDTGMGQSIMKYYTGNNRLQRALKNIYNF